MPAPGMVESVLDTNGEVRRAISGDREALGNLLEQVGPVVRRDIETRIPARWRSLLSDDDVMQQTYADAFRGITRFVPLGDGAFRAWLSNIAKCNLRDALKMLQADKRGGAWCRVDPNVDGKSYLNLFDVLSSSGTSPTRQVARGEAAEMLEEAVASLPDAYQIVVRRFDLEGCPAADIASELGRSTGAVYMLRARAHDRLRHLLGCKEDFFTDSP